MKCSNCTKLNSQDDEGQRSFAFCCVTMLGDSVNTSEIDDDDDDDVDLDSGKLERTSSKNSKILQWIQFYPCFPIYSAYNCLSSHLPPTPCQYTS